MTATTPVVYADDPDAAWTFEVTDPDGNTLDFNPLVATGSGAYDITATWLGDPAPVRNIRVPLAGLAGGIHHNVYLKVPGGNDIRLGAVEVRTRR